MAALTTEQIVSIRSAFAEELSRIREPINLSKSDLQAAIAAVDLWISNNTASYLASIPEPAKSELTAKQKAWLFFLCAQKRFDII